MMKNVGNTDKLLRVILGLAIFYLGYTYKSWWGLVGFAPILTAVFSFCPAYALFKINTCCKKGEGQGKGGCCCGG